jgi:N-glycosylase/DNA lyase
MAADVIWECIKISTEELSIKDVLPTGQAFRWHKTKETPEEWTGVIGNRVYSLRQSETHLKYHVHNKGIDSNEENEEILKDYFQLDISYKTIFSKLTAFDDVLKGIDYKHEGVRVLKQDPTEALIAFICSSNNNIGRISQMMNKLCRHFGLHILTYEGVEFYSFPLLESLAIPSAEATLRELGFGYRAKYVTEAAKCILSKPNGWLESLRGCGYQQAWELLQDVSGVGPKVADCICLMGLGLHEAVPVDTHIRSVAAKYYGLNIKGKNLTLHAYKEIGDMFRNRYGLHAGLVQAVSYCFHYN